MASPTRNSRTGSISEEAALFASLVSISATQDSPDVALEQCLKVVCEYVGWPVGHLYVVAADGTGDLVPTNAWYLDDPDGYFEFREITSKTRFASGVGLPGRVLSIGEPVWIPDVQKDANFPRNKIAADIGVRAAFGVPVETEGQVSAVLEFFTAEALEPDEHILEVVWVLGHQIGQILERQRAGKQLLEARENAEAEVRAQLAEELRIGKTLAQIGAITSTSDITGFYEQFVNKVRELIPCDRMVVSIIDLDADLVTDRFVAGEDTPGGEQGATSKYSNSASAGMSTEDLPRYYVGEDLQCLSDRFPEWKDRLDAGYVSALVAALEWEGQTLGHLVLRSRNPDAFADRDAALVGQIASQISGAIVSTELNEQLRREAEVRRLISEIGSLLTSPDLGPVWPQLATLIAELIPHDRIVLSSFDLDREVGTDRYVGGIEVHPGESGRTYPLPKSPAAEVIPRLDFIEPKILSGDEHRDYARLNPDWQEKLDAGLLSVMACSLVWEGEPVGFISLRAKDQDAFGSRDLDRLSRITRQLAGAMANAELNEQLQSEVRERDVLAAVTRSVNSDLDLDGVLKRIGDEIQTLIPFDRLTYTSLNAETRELTRVYVRGSLKDLPLTGETYSYSEEGSHGQEFHDPETDLWEWGFKLEGDSGEKGDLPLPSWIEVPIGTPGEIPMGFLSLRSEKRNAYSKSDQRLLAQIIDQVTPALRNSIAHDEAIRLSEERAALADIGRAVNSNLDVDAVYAAVADALKPLILYDRLTISLLTPDGQLQRAFVRGIEMAGAVGETFTLEVDRRDDGTRLLQNGEQTPLEESFVAAGLISWAEVPLGAADSPIGYLSVRSTEAEAYTELDIELLKQVSAQITPAIENANLFAESQALSDEREMLSRIGVIVTSAPTVDEIFPNVLEEIKAFVPFDRLVVTVTDPQDKRIPVDRYVGGSVSFPSDQRQLRAIENTAMAELWDKMTPTVLQGEEFAEWSKGSPDQLERYESGLVSMLVLPLVLQGSSIGVLSLRSKVENAYSDAHLSLMTRVSGQIAGAIANTNLNEGLELQAERQEALAEIGRVVNSNLDVDAVYSAVADALEPLVSYDRLSISLLMPDGQLERAFVRGTAMEGEGAGTTAFDPDRRPDGSLLFDSASQFPPMDPFASVGLQSWAEVPLGTGDSPIGYLSARSAKSVAYTELDIDLMKQVSAQITPAIENARLIARLENQARYDSVTSLLNRVGFESSFDNAAITGDESAGTVIAIVIEQIRELEDRFGVAFADKLLAALGRRLDEEYGERGIVGRIGHDEFGIGLLGREEAIAWSGAASDIVASCSKPFEIDGELIGLDVSLGVSLYPGHATLAEDLTRMAVLATRSVGQSVDRVTLFNSEMEDSASDHVRVLTAFRQGMTDREVLLHYQPKVDLGTRRIVGAEALVRWQSPERGMVSPGAFLPVLESSGYMWEFTCWTVAEAMEQLRIWTDASQAGEWDPVQIAINISARDFQDRRLPSQIMSNLELWGVDPALIEIEVTETAMMEAPEAAIEVCSELKQMGITIAIDDFGVGQSPLVYLDRLDVDLIKIDRAFVTDIDQSESRQSIVRAMVELGSQLGMKVLAEGVETEEEASVIRDTGCHYGQGYLWARPMPADEFQQLLQDGLKPSA